MTELHKAIDNITVVRVRAKVTGELVQGCDLYVGRACYRKPWRQQASEFANPFSAKRYGRAESLVLYEQHVRDTPELWHGLDQIAVVALKQYQTGLPMSLGCWCAPEPCHADVIVKLLKEKLLTTT